LLLQAIQRCIRSELAGCTCLTIAHRLHTIMDADRILLMEKGEVGEYDTPAALATKPGELSPAG
jgi:ABC-type multidrug transport system fused ATPase/permease subunit